MSEVVVGLIIRSNLVDEPEYLLVNSVKDFGEYTDHYYPPGGHLEVGEDKESALKREIQEEINLVVRPVRQIAETMGDIDNQITYWWLCEVVGGEIKIDLREIKDANFFTKEEIRKLPLWPATRKFFDEYVFI